MLDGYVGCDFCIDYTNSSVLFRAVILFAMAASSSSFSSMMHKETPALNIPKHSKDFSCCHWNISYKSPDHLKLLSQRSRIHCQANKIEHTPSSLSVGQKFQLDDVIEAQQFDRETLSAIFEVAREMESIEKNSPGSQLLKGYLMATLFYEPSTRTRLSFESAMKRLGGEVLTTENAREFSSAAKGETLEGKVCTFIVKVCHGCFSLWFS